MRARKWSGLARGLLAAACLSAGCGDDDDVISTDVDSGPPVRTPPVVAGSNGDGQNGDRQVLTDDEIAGVLIAANSGELLAGELAIDRANDPSVRAFARRVVFDHEASNLALAELIETTALEWRVPELAQFMNDESAITLERLEAENEADFDFQFMLAMREVHARTLAIIDSTLLPSVVDPMLERHVVAMRSAATRHAIDAVSLLETLTRVERLPGFRSALRYSTASIRRGPRSARAASSG